MSVAEDVKAKIDIVDLIATEVQLKRSGSTFKAPCPFHAEKTPSFIVNPDRQTWHCFGACSEGGDIFSWEMKRHNVDFREALQRLAQRAGVQLRARTPEQTRQDEQRQRLVLARTTPLCTSGAASFRIRPSVVRRRSICESAAFHQSRLSSSTWAWQARSPTPSPIISPHADINCKTPKRSASSWSPRTDHATASATV